MNYLNQLFLLPKILLISKRTVLCIGLGFSLFSMTTWNLFLASPIENSIPQTWARGRRCESNRSLVWTFPHTLSFLSEPSAEVSTGEHPQCPPPPRASRSNCAVSLFSYLMCSIHSMCISLTERPKPQEQNRKPGAHLTNECHLSRKKAMCVQPQRNVFDHALHVTYMSVRCSIPAEPIPTESDQWAWSDQS